MKDRQDQTGLTANASLDMSGVIEQEQEELKGRWVLGQEGYWTCSNVCESGGWRCDSERQSTITTKAKMQEALKSVGYTCKAFVGTRSYAGAPFSAPGDLCVWLTPGAKSVCNANRWGHHRPLCYCVDMESGWVRGDAGDSCNSVCMKQGARMQCDSYMQNTLTTNAKMQEAMQSAGYTCQSFGGTRSYPGAPFDNGQGSCTPLTPGKVSSCMTNLYAHHHPLCYCQGPGKFPKAECMSKQLCYDELSVDKIADKVWECKCLWGSDLSDDMCLAWKQCLEEKKSAETQTLKDIIKVSGEILNGGPISLQDAGSGSEMKLEEVVDELALTMEKQGEAAPLAETRTTDNKADKEGCLSPRYMDIMAIECQCGAAFRKVCEDKGTPQERQACWHQVLCSHEGICASFRSSAACQGNSNLVQTSPVSILGEVNVTLLTQRTWSEKNYSDESKSDSLEESLLDKRSC